MKILLIIWLVLLSLQTSGYLWWLGSAVYPRRKFHSRADDVFGVVVGVVLMIILFVVLFP